MNLTDFTEKDYELLIEAVDAWEKEPTREGAMSSMVGAIIGGISGDKPPDRATFRTELKAAEDKGRARKSIAILLRAKCELARQAIQAAEIAKP